MHVLLVCCLTSRIKGRAYVGPATVALVATRDTKLSECAAAIRYYTTYVCR